MTEFKWFVTLRFNDDAGYTEKELKRAYALAKDAFFDSLNADGMEWDADEEDK